MKLDPDPSPVGEGESRGARPGWGGKRTVLRPSIPRALRSRMTPQEVKLWNWLREEVVPLGFHFRRQFAVERYIADFACRRGWLIIEIDGGQHGSERGQTRDATRDRRLVELGYHVLRFTNADVDYRKRVVLDTIYAALVEQASTESPAPVGFADSPSPSGEGSLR